MFLACNGMTECFVAAAMTAAEVDVNNRWMVLFSAVFLLAAWGSTQYLGSVGFIVANAINMAIRTARASYKIGEYAAEIDGRTPAGKHPLWAALPSAPTAAALAVSLVATVQSAAVLCCDSGWRDRGLHLGVLAVTLASTLGTILVSDRPFVRAMIQLFRGRPASAE